MSFVATHYLPTNSRQATSPPNSRSRQLMSLQTSQANWLSSPKNAIFSRIKRKKRSSWRSSGIACSESWTKRPMETRSRPRISRKSLTKWNVILMAYCANRHSTLSAQTTLLWIRKSPNSTIRLQAKKVLVVTRWQMCQAKSALAKMKRGKCLCWIEVWQMAWWLRFKTRGSGQVHRLLWMVLSRPSPTKWQPYGTHTHVPTLIALTIHFQAKTLKAQKAQKALWKRKARWSQIWARILLCLHWRKNRNPLLRSLKSTK